MLCSNHFACSGYVGLTTINSPMKLTIIVTLCLSSLMASAQLQPVKSGVYRWIEYPVKISEQRESRKILEGTSSHLDYLEIHASTQMAGATPGPAHANKDIEEIIIVKAGTLKVSIEDQSRILGAGGVIILMPREMHSLENVGDGPLTYYVMRYRSKKKMNPERGIMGGGSMMVHQDSLTFKPSYRGGGKAYFDRSTAMCERLEMHLTQLNEKGPSHEPHLHQETEIILMLSGATEMMINGKNYAATAGDFYLMESKLLHGIRNATDAPCSYLAFKWK